MLKLLLVPAQNRGFSLSKHKLSLLPKADSYWEALISSLPNIKPRLHPKNSDFQRLTNIFSKLTLVVFLLSFLLGYQPAWSFPPIKTSPVLAQEPTQIQAVTAESIPSFQLPFQGYISTHYSFYHPGTDIATSFGTEIKSVAEGTVEQTNFGFLGYGNHVIISHSGGYQSLYGHMDKIYVKTGQKVTIEDIIGTVGLTGFTSGPHTHLEITQDGKSLDPEKLLPSLSDKPSAQYLGAPIIATPSPIIDLTPKLTQALKPNF